MSFFKYWSKRKRTRSIVTKTKVKPPTIEIQKLWINGIALILIPVVVAWVSNTFASVIKQNEVQGQFVEIAIDILKETPDEKISNKNLRKWAINVVNKYSGVPLDSITIKELTFDVPLLQNNITLRPPIYLNSQFIGKPIHVHPNFTKSLDKLNTISKDLDIEIYVTSSFRTSLNWQVTQALDNWESKHYIGYAIDMNIKYKNELYNSKLLSKYPKDLPDPVIDFIQYIIDDPSLEWGGRFNKNPNHISLITSDEKFIKIYQEMTNGKFILSE